MPRAGKQLNQVRLSVPTASTCKAQPAPGSQGPGSDVPQLSPGPDASSWSVAPGLQPLWLQVLLQTHTSCSTLSIFLQLMVQAPPVLKPKLGSWGLSFPPNFLNHGHVQSRLTLCDSIDCM